MATNPERSVEEKAVDDGIEQESNDKNATIDGDITADAADRFAESIRPSWVQADSTPSVQKEADERELSSNSSIRSDAASVASQSDSIREDTDAELKLAAATILTTKSVRKKTLLWAGGVTACFLLIVLSVVTQKKQKTNLWNTAKVDKPTQQQSPTKDETDEAQSSPKLKSGSPTRPTVGPSAIAVGSPTQGVEESPSVPETKDLNASSQSAGQPTSKPIDVEPSQEAAEPPKVRIRVVTVPATAELTLDGSSVPNPFDQLLLKNGQHLFVARAQGYSNRSRRIAFDRDRELSLQLVQKKPRIRRTRSQATKNVSRRKRVKTAPRRTSTTRKAASSTRRSRKGFVSENPY